MDFRLFLLSLPGLLVVLQCPMVKNQLNKDTQSPTMRKDISMLSGDSLDDCTKLAKDFEFNGFSL